MSYSKKTWKNGSSGATPLNADGLNDLEGRVATGVAGTLHVLVHDGSTYPTRPAGVAAGLVRYVGPTQPTTWQTLDEWVKTS